MDEATHLKTYRNLTPAQKTIALSLLKSSKENWPLAKLIDALREYTQPEQDDEVIRTARHMITHLEILEAHQVMVDESN